MHNQRNKIFNKVSSNIKWGHKKFEQKGDVISLGFDSMILASLKNNPDYSDKFYIWFSYSKKNFLIYGKISNYENNFILTPDKESLNTYQELLTYNRKHDHIDICLKQNVEESNNNTGFQNINFIPDACPQINTNDLNTKSFFIGTEFALPIMITGMTGGVEKAQQINNNLAAAASYYNIPMGVGSQRLALEFPQYKNIFSLKQNYPKLFLIANIGFSEIINADNPLEICKKAIEMIDANCLAIHLNALQELIQLEGSQNFQGFIQKLENICSNLKIHVLIKEVGSGINISNMLQLKEAGVTAIDIGGRGGTSWGYIEGLRRQKKDLGNTFRNWGIPTAYNISAAKDIGIQISATGGIRSGLMVAKALALGANMAGVGLPLFLAALESEEKVFQTLEQFKQELQITMMATSSKNISDLKNKVCWGDPYEYLCKQQLRKQKSL
jgi:isopentenyl-diphosphate Delta-isomerase